MKIFCCFLHEAAKIRDCYVGRNFGTEWTKTHLPKKVCTSDSPLVETWWKRWKTPKKTAYSRIFERFRRWKTFEFSTFSPKRRWKTFFRSGALIWILGDFGKGKTVEKTFFSDETFCLSQSYDCIVKNVEKEKEAVYRGRVALGNGLPLAARSF